MPANTPPTLATFRGYIREVAELDGLTISDGAARGIASEARRRWIAQHDEDADTRNLGMISDPTPRAAIRKILSDCAAARRLGLVAA